MRPLLIAQKMTEIDDRFVLNSILPASPVAKAPRFGVLSRFLSSGVGAAVISGVVAVGVLVAIVLAGRNTPALPPVTTDNPPPVTESTEEESGSETEDVTEDTVIDTPEEAEARKDELISILDGLDYKWNILNDPSYYFDQYAPVKEFGKYGVPYMLDYIMEREGETDAEELKRLGVILHFAYHNLGITDTSEWYCPEPYSTDLFVNTKCLMDHLEEYGLRVNALNVYSLSNQTNENKISTLSKDDIYKTLDEFNLDDYMYYGIINDYYPEAPSLGSWELQRAYSVIASLGIEAVPYILEYLIDSQDVYDAYALTNDTDYFPEYQDRCFLLSTAYDMLGVKGHYSIHWISPNGQVNGRDSFVLLAQYLLDYINENGLCPIYPFDSAADATVHCDKITRQLEDSMGSFRWILAKDLDGYQADASLVTVFGPYAVPYILDYILSHEGQPLTPDEEMNLGVLLHLCYRMLEVETTAEWHMPAEAVKSTTDPFPYARELAAHLGEYGLGPVE